MINASDIINSKFWDHLTLSKVIVYIFTALCIVFFFKAEDILNTVQHYSDAKYGSVSKATFIDSLHKQENYWHDSLQVVNRKFWHRLSLRNKQIDSLMDIIEKFDSH